MKILLCNRIYPGPHLESYKSTYPILNLLTKLSSISFDHKAIHCIIAFKHLKVVNKHPKRKKRSAAQSCETTFKMADWRHKSHNASHTRECDVIQIRDKSHLFWARGGQGWERANRVTRSRSSACKLHQERSWRKKRASRNSETLDELQEIFCVGSI